jgi:hypothetical protein
MESELPKVVQEKISYYREILSKLNDIIQNSRNQSFKSLEEESAFLKEEIAKNVEGVNILKLMREVVLNLGMRTSNPYNYQSYEDKSIAYNLTNDYAETKEIQFMKLLEEEWDVNNENNLPIYVLIFEKITEQFVMKLNTAISFSLKENELNKQYVEFNNSISLKNSLFFIKINNFQAIQNISEKIPIDAQFITFTGENGDGKTSILQAIGLGLYNSDSLSDEDRGNESSRVSIKYKDEDKFYTNNIFNNPNKPIEYQTKRTIKLIKKS